jgi:hypothetical protein
VDIVLRAAVAYAFMIFLLRIIGRRELPTLAPSDLVLLVVMGDLVQNGVTQSDQSVTGVLLALQMAGVGFRKPSARQAGARSAETAPVKASQPRRSPAPLEVAEQRGSISHFHPVEVREPRAARGQPAEREGAASRFRTRRPLPSRG